MRTSRASGAPKFRLLVFYEYVDEYLDHDDHLDNDDQLDNDDHFDPEDN